MKTFFYIFSLIIAGCFCFISCKDENEPLSGATFHSRAIMRYVFPDTIQAFETKNKSAGLFELTGNYVSEYRQPNIYYELAKKYNDENYNRVEVPLFTEVLYTEISKVAIETLQDFDDQHLKGSDISELVEFTGYSYAKFIESRYTYNIQDYSSPFHLSRWTFNIVKYDASAINKQNATLMTPYFKLNFKKEPTHKGEYKFKISVQLESTTITHIFNYKF